MTADPDSRETDQSPDHMVYKGVTYDVVDATRVDDAPDGSELWEVWTTERGEGNDSEQS